MRPPPRALGGVEAAVNAVTGKVTQEQHEGRPAEGAEPLEMEKRPTAEDRDDRRWNDRVQRRAEDEERDPLEKPVGDGRLTPCGDDPFEDQARDERDR